MIMEHAVLPVRPGQEADFEDAFSLAKTIILSSPRCESLTLSHCLERPSAYLEWRALLRHFDEPALVVEHFQPVQSG